MKKIILPCIISFIIMTSASCSLASTGTVNATAVRIRESASTESKIVTNIYKNDKVEILEEDGEWYKIKYGDNVGYVKAEFIAKKGADKQPENTTEVSNNITETNTTTETPVQPNNSYVPPSDVQEINVGGAVSISNPVKIRIMPNLSSALNIEIAQGTNVIVQAKMGNWYKISTESVSGWITEQKLIIASSKTEQAQLEPKPEEKQPEELLEEKPVEQDKQPTPEENTTPVQNIVPEQKVEETQTPEDPKPAQKNKTAIVTVETARVRKSASTKAGIIDMLDQDDVVTITGEEGEFYKITCDKISSGYISKTLVKVKDVTSRGSLEERETTANVEPVEEIIEKVAEEATEESTPGIAGNDVVEFAKKYLGYKYVLGCSSPEDGFDCSGFTRYVYGNFGFKLGQVAASQTSLGDVVERESLQTGDLILFYDDAKTKIGHCGIYMSDGDFIHSANPKRGVVIDNLNTNSYYNQRFVTARRIVK